MGQSGNAEGPGFDAGYGEGGARREKKARCCNEGQGEGEKKTSVSGALA